MSDREAFDASLRQQERTHAYYESRGIAWAQRCLEGENKNETLRYVSGRAAEKLLCEHGWKSVDIKWTFNRKLYLPGSKYKRDYERITYRSDDGRFEVALVFSRGGNPGTCWCGFKKIGAATKSR